MAFINTKGIIDNLNNFISVAPDGEGIPVNVSPDTQLVIDVNPLNHPLGNVLQTTENIIDGVPYTKVQYTTPKNLDFYLTQFIIWGYGGSNNLNPTLTCVLNGATQTLSTFVIPSGTITALVVNTSLALPLLLDRNTNITITAPQVGVFDNDFFVSIYGFLFNTNSTGLVQSTYS
jgi:hypothetical protein